MKIINICKAYKEKQVLEKIDLTLIQNKFYVILGASGSGKSTLLKTIAGIEKPDRGEIFLNDNNITDISIQKRNIGYIFQEALLFPHMTVFENVSYSLKIQKIPQKEREEICDKYMKYLHIEDLKHNMPHELSGGQKQRVALARSLVLSPKILLLDEPFSSLDYNLRIELGEVLKKLQKELCLTLIFVTHDIEESLRLADEVIFLHEGKVIEKQDPMHIYYAPRKEQTALFMGEYNKICGKLEANVFKTLYSDICLNNEYNKLECIYIRPNKIQLIASSEGKYSIEKIFPHAKATRIKLKDCDLKIDTYFEQNYSIGQKVAIEIVSIY